jgi:tetratricopeptide (TPR) repeat protein
MAPHHQRIPWPRAVCLLLVCLAATGAQDQDQGKPQWWDRRWTRRFAVQIPPQSAEAGCASLWVHVPDGADYGGRDLRVVAPDGKPVPSSLITVGGGDGGYLIAFETRGTGNRYFVYYDNPDAAEVDAFSVPRGLVYETYLIPPGARADSWPGACETLDRAGPRCGAGFRPQVFGAHNPFGSTPGYIAVYRGYLDCPQDGSYTFATVSDHSSFLLVDDQLVVQWTGPHNIWSGVRGERNGTLDLDAGTHAFLYVHFSYPGQERAVAAWKLPGRPAFEVIPPEAFPAVPWAWTVEAEQLGRPICADFICQRRSYCEAGDSEMVAALFRSTSSSPQGTPIRRYLWDFGDGQTSDEREPLHVFLATGIYDVTLAVASSPGDWTETTKRVSLQPLWYDLDFPRSKLEQFWDTVSGYDLEALPTACLLGARDLLVSLERHAARSAVDRELLRRRAELRPTLVCRVSLDMAAHCRRTGAAAETARQYLRLAVASAPASDPALRFTALLALSDNYLYDMGRADQAEEGYRRLVDEFPDAEPGHRRRALVGLGDSYRWRGDAEQALLAYRQAEQTLDEAVDAVRSVVVGAAARDAELHLQQGDPEAALDCLTELALRYPVTRLDPAFGLLEVRALGAKGDLTKARHLAGVFLHLSDDPNYAPDLHMAAAEACAGLGLAQELAAHCRDVVSRFPESPACERARRYLETIAD